MEEIIKDLERRKREALLLGGQSKIDLQHSRGRLTARERIDKLADPGTFMELGMLNHSDVPGMEDKGAGDGIISGIGKVDGRPAVIQAADKTVLAATEGAVHFRKSKMMHEYAIKRGFPIFGLGEGGGLRMPDGMGSDGISDKLFPMSLLRHGREVPYIASIMGLSFGGPTWSAVSADFNVMVKGACMAVSGPRMLELASGEVIDPEALGGWQIHAQQTGQADAFADNDEQCINKMKEFFSYMPGHAGEEPPFKSTGDDPCRRVDELVKIVPTARHEGYDMKALIRSIVDNGAFFEIKELYGPALITILARLAGRVVGIIANQPMYNAGSAGPDECDKAIEFICLCDSYNIPLVFLHDIPGFRISSYAEQHKMPTKIMVWNQALAWSTVPKLSVVVRKSIGAAFGNMCGPFMGADFVVAWPTAEISFTGPEVGVNVVYGRQLAESSNPIEERKKLLALWEFDSAPYKAAGKHLIDDVIDPRDTRRFLCQALEFACCKNGGKSERLLANWPTGY
ncbi:MAG: methylmalonyl-CoA decarboxylase [Peptococcaceae bacterium BICA1-7]|nr:MAG: methylmalonyl-CoA decarboxylase [Peptococcaceae bacterium BICA1-7]HBV97973.1 methylmalonyl-CoA decarboxylase [Desulfotomaculum sp.]